jgi:hypothetical protein
MSKCPKEDLEFVARVICDEYSTTQAEKVARILKGGGLHSITFGKLTSGNKPQIVVESPIQIGVMNAMRNIELGLWLSASVPAWVVKKK